MKNLLGIYLEQKVEIKIFSKISVFSDIFVT